MDLRRVEKLPIYVDFVLRKQRPKLCEQCDKICSGNEAVNATQIERGE